ncbi:MAG: UDP-N-acetylmuramoyl-tripeptide--D-alanyl-D-alanine ligase [Phycisphaeraceae bacterium]
MSFWTPRSLRDVTSGRYLPSPDTSPSHRDLQGLSTDTRSLIPGQVFLALRGDNFDGHDFLEAAAEAGAGLLMIDRPEAAAALADRCDVLVVNDTLKALTQMATAYRRGLTGRVIAITGSAGKTTTKHLIQTILSRHHRGSASPRSFNNHIGVPLTLLQAQRGDAYTVVEVGTNAPGEIAALAKIVQPDVAVITHVGAAHLEGLGSLDAILREKASLLNHLQPDGLAIVNGDIAGLHPYRKIVRATLSFGTAPGCDLRLTDYQPDATACTFEVNDRTRYRLPMLGRHNAMNALAAIAVARHMQLSEAQIAEALAEAPPADMRLEVRTVGRGDRAITLINDAYNANPDSVAAALGVLADYPATGRRVAVLGDMLELGDEAAARHRQVGEQVLAAKLDLAVFAGPLMMFAAEAVNRTLPSDRVLALPDWGEPGTLEKVAALLQPGDTVLLKGSRGMRMERLIQTLEHRLSSDREPDALSR